jgi:hypothetical protein
VNAACVTRCVGGVTEEALVRQGALTLLLLQACCRVVCEKDAMRSGNALHIVGLFLRAVFRKKFPNFGFDVLHLVGGGFELGDAWFRRLMDGLVGVMREPGRAREHELALDLMIALASGCDNIAANSLIEYLHRDDVFDALVACFSTAVLHDVAFKAVLVVVLVANYQKYEMRNMYVTRLTALHGTQTLRMFADFLSVALAKKSSSNVAVGGALLMSYELVYLCKGLGVELIFPDFLRVFLEHASVLCVAVKDERSALQCKMALLTLVPLAEDAAVLAALHDPKFSWQRALQISRKTDNTGIVGALAEREVTPVCWLLDVLLEFLKNNIHTSLQIRLHTLVLSLFHRVLCHHKAQHVCVKRFKWEALWKQMFRLLGFVAKEEWFKRAETLDLVQTALTIFNLFITYGDTFLPSGNDYDFLYYEMIRESKTLIALQELVEKHAAGTVLSLHMENIAAIVAHFKSRIDLWTKSNSGAVISPEEVLTLIKRNYGSLKLTLLDNLDSFQTYSENPSQVNFFRQFNRVLAADAKATYQ